MLKYEHKKNLFFVLDFKFENKYFFFIEYSSFILHEKKEGNILSFSSDFFAFANQLKGERKEELIAITYREQKRAIIVPYYSSSC